MILLIKNGVMLAPSLETRNAGTGNRDPGGRLRARPSTTDGLIYPLQARRRPERVRMRRAFPIS